MSVGGPIWSEALQRATGEAPSWHLVESGTILEAWDRCWVLLRGSAEERLEHSGGGQVSFRCRQGDLLGAAALVMEGVSATVRLTRPSVIIELEPEDLRLLLVDHEVGPRLRRALLLQRFPQRAPGLPLLETAEGEEAEGLQHPRSDTQLRLSQLGQFLWRHMDGRHTLQQLAQVLAMTGSRPDSSELIALTSWLEVAGLAVVPRLRGPLLETPSRAARRSEAEVEDDVGSPGVGES